MEKKIKLRPWEILLLVLFIGFVLGLAIKWFIEQRRKLFQQWRQAVQEVRDLRGQIRILGERKAKLEKYARRTLFTLKFILVIGVITAAYWMHVEFALNWITAVVSSAGAARVVYAGAVFLFAKKIYQLNEALEIAEAALIRLYERMGRATHEDVLCIETKIELKLQEALSIKQQLRPEVQKRA